MARKKHAKHSKNTILASSSARHPFSKLSASAATAVVGASLALSVTPALAQETTSAKQQETTVIAAKKNNQDTPKAPAATSATPEKKQLEGGTPGNTNQLNQQPGALTQASAAPASMPVQGADRSATPDDANQPKVQNEINISKDQKDSVPNMYAWGSSDNVYVDKIQKNSVTFNIAKPDDGSTITNVAIFPSDTNGVDNQKSRKFLEYYSDPAAKDEHQSYSGTYEFKVNPDGTATLTMNQLYTKGTVTGGASAYSANRCIYVYGTDKDGKTVVLYKTNIARAATLVPPKTAGSIVLKYNEKLTDKQIKDKLKAALDAPTEAPGKKSVREQINAASTSKGVGGRTGASGEFVQTPDDADKKVIINDQQAYEPGQLAKINQVTSKDDQPKTYVAGAQTLKTYLVSDLGYKSEALPLTVARYDTRIDKPIVDDVDINKLTEDQKADICKKLANLNHVTQDKVKFNDQGEAVISFAGVDEKDAPKIALKDLVLKKFKEDQITVPANDKATVIYNAIGYSKAELERIKQSILDANKDNKDLGLTSTDQITLEYIAGDTVTSGHNTQGISNGQQENTITVKIKTDKAYAEFTSDVKQNKLTRLVDIRKDYNVSWDKTKNKLDGRDSDEGLSWSNDSHTTIIYRYDPTAAKELKTDDIIKLLKATPKDQQAGLRDLTGGETLEHEDSNGKPRKSHMHYALKDDEPTGELSLGNMSGAYWIGNQKVSHSDEKLGDNQSIAGSYSWDPEAGSVTVAGKKDKIYKARLFVQPYAMTYYKDVYLEQGRNPGNTAKAINLIFVPQTNHKTKDLKDSIGEHKLADDKKTPTESKYYNASKDKKDAYDEALKEANAALEAAGNTEDSKLSEALKARIDNATINLNKARAELDGPDTDKEKLKASIDENGKAEEGKAPTGTQATNQFKNVSDPDFKTADGKADDAKNKAAKEAKKAYDEALQAAEAARDDANATQKAVDDAKAKLDAARAKLNDFTTNKDELSAAIAQHGKVNTGDATKQGDEKLKTADPTYQNSSEKERKAYDDAVAQADKVSKDPNASQKEVNEAIKKLKDAKAALDANATDKAPLDAAVQKSFDNPDPKDTTKQSVFYKNAKGMTNDPDAQQAVTNYDNALKKAKEVLANDKATKKDVDDAKKALEAAEAALHADKYQTKATDLAEAIADNFSGYLMPAYFNAFDKAQAGDEQAKKDFKAYNDAYHAAKDLMEQLKKPGSTIKQADVDAVKNQLIDARKIIDTYATDTSRLSAAVFNDIAIKNSPAYKNLKALAEKQNPSEEEKAEVEAAKKAKEAYDKAVEKLHKALTNKLPKDQQNGKDIPDSNIPKKDGDLNDKDYLKDIQAHKNGEPLNRDVDSILQEMNDAAKALDKFATKTDELIKSINEDAATHPSPAFKNASHPSFQKPDGSGADEEKNNAAKAAADAYGLALNKAKEKLNDPNATQKDIDDAKAALDKARTELDKYNTDTTKLKESVEKHGTKEEVPAAKEGTLTSDAYRNASDPHFLTADGKPDETKNKQAVADKKAYDEALTKAQELLKKHDDKDTPQDAKPTQKEINDALKTLDEARKKLEDNYKTVTTDLENEIKKSTPEHAPAATGDEFENTPEFKNADAKKDGTNDNADVKAYKEALKKARELVQAANPLDPAAKNSSHPTQKQINDALEALKQAKQAITDGYKTDVDKLKQAKEYAEDVFKKTPEYKNATAIKNDNNNAKHEQAGKDLDGTDQKPGLSKLIEKIATKLQDTSKMTQTEVDALVKQLVTAQKKITENYKTDATKLAREVGDKDADGNPVVPPFEASVAYKNALAKKDAESEEDAKKDTSATKKLKDYADKLAEAQKLIDQVNSPDQNAAADSKPTQKQVDDALEALKKAKQALVDAFKTDTTALQNEVDDKDEHGKVKDPSFENTPEFANLKAKIDGDKKPDDLIEYEQALASAKELIKKNTGKMTDPNDPNKDIDVPKDQLPSQGDVDAALKRLQDIKAKILANYVTSPKDLYDEVDKSKDGDDDKRPDLFEDSGAYMRALNDKAYDEHGKPVDNDKVARYKKALAAAKAMLDKFDRATGKPKPGVTDGPTQKELDAALAELQAAKKAINESYRWINYFPLEGWSTTNPEPEQKPGESAPAPAPAPAPAVSEPEDSLVAPASESSARVAPAHAPKHLAQTSDPTNGFALATMLGSAFGFIVAGLKRKRNRR